MANPVEDLLSRAYLVVSVDGSSDGANVATLLERAAEQLRTSGKIDVHAVAYEQTSTANAASCSLTIYYDRVERRSVPRRS